MHTAFDWNTLYLTCFVSGLVLSIVAFVTGAAHLHIGHFHFGHGHGLVSKGSAHHSLGFLNGFTLMAFLTWFGAAGYLLKADSHADFVSAIEHMRLRKIYLPRRLTGFIGDTTPPRKGRAVAKEPSTESALLTWREQQVFALIAKGKCSHEVARRLGISQRAVAAYRKHAMRKLGSAPLSGRYPPAHRDQRIGA